jgi:hypothetical protein
MSSPAPERRRSTRRRPELSYAEADPDAELERGGKRRRSAAGILSRKSGADKGESKRSRGLAAAAAIEDDEDMCASEPDAEEMRREEEEEEAAALEAEEQANAATLGARRKRRVATRLMSKQKKEEDAQDHFVGDPIPDDEARRRWPERYKPKVIPTGSIHRSQPLIMLMDRRHVLPWLGSIMNL